MGVSDNNFNQLEVYDAGVSDVTKLLENAFEEANLSHEDVSALTQLSIDQVSALLLDGDITVPDLAVLLAHTGKRLDLLPTDVDNEASLLESATFPGENLDTESHNPSLYQDEKETKDNIIGDDKLDPGIENTVVNEDNNVVNDSDSRIKNLDGEDDSGNYISSFPADSDRDEDIEEPQRVDEDGVFRFVSWSVNEQGEDEYPSLSVGEETIMLTPPVLAGILSGLKKLDTTSDEVEPVKARRSVSDVVDAGVGYWGKHKITGTAGAVFLVVALFVVIYGFIITGTA